MPGDYAIYLISVESSNLKNDSVVLLEVGKILYNNASIGYVQRLTGVYNMKSMYTRHFHNPVLLPQRTLDNPTHQKSKI